MSRRRTFVYSIALGVSLLAGGMVSQPRALAQAVGAFQAQIAAFGPKLESARSAQADLEKRVACLNQRSSDLMNQRENLERHLGGLRSKEKDLLPKVQAQEAAYRGFQEIFSSEHARLLTLRRELDNLRAQQRAQEDWVRKCEEEKPWERLWGLACRFDLNFAKAVGQIQDHEGAIATAERNEQTARGSWEFAKAQLDGSQRELETTRNQARQLEADIARSEADISKTAQAVSDVRAVAYPLQNVVDEFARALNAASDDVDLVDERPRALRKLNYVAGRVDEAMAGGTHAARRADEALGAGWMASCQAR